MAESYETMRKLELTTKKLREEKRQKSKKEKPHTKNSAFNENGKWKETKINGCKTYILISTPRS